MPIRFLKHLGSRLFRRQKKEVPPKQADHTPDRSVQAAHRPAVRHSGRPHSEDHRPQHSSRRGHAAGDAESPKPRTGSHGAHGHQGHSAESPKIESVAPEARPWSRADFEVPPADGKTRFHDFDLPDPVMHAVADAGFRYCTPIQAQVLPYAGQSRNVAGQAQTGTGKTAAFLVLMLARFLKQAPPARKHGAPRGLILAPTRELVVQIVHDADMLAKHSGIKTIGVYGGMDYNKQQQALEREHWDIVVATPGRLLDFKGRGRLDLGRIEVLVIDEADRMLDMGFIPDVRRIIRATPPRDRRQTLLFSATLTDDVMRLASEWMPDPVLVKIEPDQVAVDTVRQIVYALSSSEKFTVLCNLLAKPEVSRVLVFSNRRVDCDRIGDALRQQGVQCEVLSGDVPQKKRLNVLEDFKSGRVRVVVATDVAGRGLHVADVSHVINFDLPYEPEAYVHRIGRTGRAGADGTAISFACENEAFAIPEIEKLLGEPLRCMQPEEELLRPLKRTAAPRHPRSHEGARDGEHHHRRPGGPGRGHSSGGRGDTHRHSHPA